MNDQKTTVSSALVIGALAGLAATAPMTLFMQQMHQQLPARERYPLPPSEIVEELTEQAGIDDQIDQSEHLALTLLAHFGYGAAAGALYAPLAQAFHPPARRLGVWARGVERQLPRAAAGAGYSAASYRAPGAPQCLDDRRACDLGHDIRATCRAASGGDQFSLCWSQGFLNDRTYAVGVFSLRQRSTFVLLLFVFSLCERKTNNR